MKKPVPLIPIWTTVSSGGNTKIGKIDCVIRATASAYMASRILRRAFSRWSTFVRGELAGEQVGHARHEWQSQLVLQPEPLPVGIELEEDEVPFGRDDHVDR